jgi:hypothetical protein
LLQKALYVQVSSSIVAMEVVLRNNAPLIARNHLAQRSGTS